MRKAIIAYSTEISEAFKSTLTVGSSNSVLISWCPPITARVKLNTDGCMYLTNDKAGFGGLFRDHMGKWLLGYYGKIRSTSSLETELVGIYRGLTIMHEKGYQNVQVESDSMEAVMLVNEGNAIGHPHQALIQDANVLLRGTYSTLSHIFREANSCADHLARLGAEQLEDLVVTEESPQSVRYFVREDALGTRHLRD